MPALTIRTDPTSEELRRLARGECDGRVCRRLLAIPMALDGVSRDDAVRQAGMDRQTLRDWVMHDTLLAHRLFTDLNAILDVCCRVWNRILAEPGRIRSTCGYTWALQVEI